MGSTKNAQWRRLQTKERNALKQRIADGDEEAKLELEKRRKDERDYVRWYNEQQKGKRLAGDEHAIDAYKRGKVKGVMKYGRKKTGAAEDLGAGELVEAATPESMEMELETEDKYDDFIAALRELSDVDEMHEDSTTGQTNDVMDQHNNIPLGGLPVNGEQGQDSARESMTQAETHEFLKEAEMKLELKMLAIRKERLEVEEREASVALQLVWKIHGDTQMMQSRGV